MKDLLVPHTLASISPSPPASILSSDGPEGEELFVVTLCGSIQDRRLRLLDGYTPSSTLEHVAFGHTYYGTTIARKVLYSRYHRTQGIIDTIARKVPSHARYHHTQGTVSCKVPSHVRYHHTQGTITRKVPSHARYIL